MVIVISIIISIIIPLPPYSIAFILIIVMCIWVVAVGVVCVQPKWINRWLIHTDQSSIVITGVIMTYDYHDDDILMMSFKGPVTFYVKQLKHPHINPAFNNWASLKLVSHGENEKNRWCVIIWWAGWAIEGERGGECLHQGGGGATALGAAVIPGIQSKICVHYCCSCIAVFTLEPLVHFTFWQTQFTLRIYRLHSLKGPLWLMDMLCINPMSLGRFSSPLLLKVHLTIWLGKES